MGKHDNGLTYDVRRPGSRKPPEKVHCNRLRPQKVSHVYERAKTAAAENGGLTRVLPRSSVPSRRESANDVGSGSQGNGDPSPEDSTEPGIPRPRNQNSSKGTVTEPANDSGVTTVLEALEAEDFRYRSSEDEQSEPGTSSSEGGDRLTEDEDDETDDSDGYYVTIPIRPTVSHQRPQRVRRPPQRYSP